MSRCGGWADDMGRYDPVNRAVSVPTYWNVATYRAYFVRWDECNAMYLRRVRIHGETIEGAIRTTACKRSVVTRQRFPSSTGTNAGCRGSRGGTDRRRQRTCAACSNIDGAGRRWVTGRAAIESLVRQAAVRIETIEHWNGTGAGCSGGPGAAGVPTLHRQCRARQRCRCSMAGIQFPQCVEFAALPCPIEFLAYFRTRLCHRHHCDRRPLSRGLGIVISCDRIRGGYRINRGRHRERGEREGDLQCIHVGILKIDRSKSTHGI